MPVRSPAVAGRFYPADPGELEREIGACLGAGAGPKEPAVAVVVPHAGYVYSGSIAGATFSRVSAPDRAVVIGPNHTGRGVRRSVFASGSWDLPGGALRIDGELAERLVAGAALEPDTEAHRLEHSIEVELPFLRALSSDMSFVPICLSRLTLAECRELGKNLARVVEKSSGRTLVVASTDMSHYLPADAARELDLRAIERIQHLDPEGLYRVVTELDISMCGFVPTTVSLFAARSLGATRASPRSLRPLGRAKRRFHAGRRVRGLRPVVGNSTSGVPSQVFTARAETASGERADGEPGMLVGMSSAGSLAPGFLVAAPPLGDPNFDRSVVLLAAHGPDGAFGWVLNGREVMTFGELLVRADLVTEPPDLAGSVRVGGPVSPDQVWLVYREDRRFESFDGQLDVGQGVVASASRRVLEAIVAGEVPESLMALVGYAGWAPGQLENEIRAGAWLPTELEAALVFDVPREKLWQAAYERAGTTPIAFTSRTVGSA